VEPALLVLVVEVGGCWGGGYSAAADGGGGLTGAETGGLALVSFCTLGRDRRDERLFNLLRSLCIKRQQW
jgi:hypothetical protein